MYTLCLYRLSVEMGHEANNSKTTIYIAPWTTIYGVTACVTE